MTACASTRTSPSGSWGEQGTGNPPGAEGGHLPRVPPLGTSLMGLTSFDASPCELLGPFY